MPKKKKKMSWWLFMTKKIWLVKLSLQNTGRIIFCIIADPGWTWRLMLLTVAIAALSRIRNKARRTVPENMSDKLYQWEQPGLFRQTACDKTNTTKAVCDKAGWRSCLLPTTGEKSRGCLSYWKSRRETEFYLLNWRTEIAKLASPEEPVSL